MDLLKVLIIYFYILHKWMNEWNAVAVRYFVLATVSVSLWLHSTLYTHTITMTIVIVILILILVSLTIFTIYSMWLDLALESWIMLFLFTVWLLNPVSSVKVSSVWHRPRSQDSRSLLYFIYCRVSTWTQHVACSLCKAKTTKCQTRNF